MENTKEYISNLVNFTLAHNILAGETKEGKYAYIGFNDDFKVMFPDVDTWKVKYVKNCKNKIVRAHVTYKDVDYASSMWLADMIDVQKQHAEKQGRQFSEADFIAGITEEE